MKIRLSLLTLCLFACTTTYSADYPIKVCGEADYVVPEYQSQAEARRTAIARARTKALADKFGTIVQQTNTTTMHNAGGQTRSDFNSYTENQVRGIWLEDIGEPTINMSYVNNMLVIWQNYSQTQHIMCADMPQRMLLQHIVSKKLLKQILDFLL